MNAPLIWDRQGPRKIVGETKVSWVVVERSRENALDVLKWADVRRDNPRWFRQIFDLVPKKNPNPNHYHLQWFFSESEWKDYMFAEANRYSIGKHVEGIRDGALLRQVAELSGWKQPEGKKE